MPRSRRSATSGGRPSRAIEDIDRNLRSAGSDDLKRLDLLFGKVSMFNAAGETSRAYELLSQVRSWVEKNDAVAAAGLYTVIFSQGVVAMRRGENDNCVMCRGESSCILPIAPAAVHTNPDRLATGDPTFHRVSRSVSRGPRGPLALEPGPHDAG